MKMCVHVTTCYSKCITRTSSSRIPSQYHEDTFSLTETNDLRIIRIIPSDEKTDKRSWMTNNNKSG